MAKHVLDRPHHLQSQVEPFAAVSRRTGPEGSSRAAQKLLRRKKGPRNDYLRMRAFLRIDRGVAV